MVLMRSGTKINGKNLLLNIDAKFYASDYFNVNANKYGANSGNSLRFWGNKVWINKTDPYGWFHWYFSYWLGKG